MTLRTLTHAELQISPLNVRKKQRTAAAIAATAESIAAEGMLMPLIVHPMALTKHLYPDWGDQGGNAGGPFGALAGGHRWLAIGKLIGESRLPADHPIECIVREVDPAKMTDVSLAEQLIRQDLDAWEVHAAIARSVEQGHTPDQIAATLGQELKWVQQQLRLGTLIPEIFQAYAEGKLSIDQARAFAATEDRELQQLAWEHFQRSREFDRTPADIRAFLKIGDRELDRLLRFVGDAIYRTAGGRFELDLFADGPDERGRVDDEVLLRQLAEARLDATREQIRARTGRKDLRFAKEPPQNAGTTDYGLKIEPAYRAKHKIVLPAGEIVATLAIGADGEVDVGYWWASRKAKAAALRDATEAKLKGELDKDPAETPSQSVARVAISGAYVGDGDAFHTIDNYAKAQAARQAVKDEHGLTGDGLHVVRSLRRALLRAMLVADAYWGMKWRDANFAEAAGPEHGKGALARDYLIWSALRQELGTARATATGARGLAAGHFGSEDAEPRGVAGEFLADIPAHQTWEGAVRLVVAEPFMTAEDPAESLALYVALGEEMKNLAAAVLAGQALIRSANVPGWRVAAHDKLAELAGGDDESLRTGWKPTPAFLGLFPKLKRLELAQPHVDPDAFRTWHKHDDRTITGACAGALEATADWVHPLLSFNACPRESGVPASSSRPPSRDPAGPEEQDSNVNDSAHPEPVEGVEAAQVLVRAE